MFKLGEMVRVINVTGLSADQLCITEEEHQDLIMKFQIGLCGVIFDVDEGNESLVDIVFEDGLEVYRVPVSHLVLEDEYCEDAMTEKITDDGDSGEVGDQFANLDRNPFANNRTITNDEFTIVEDGTGAVTINGFTLYGFVDGGECSLCGGTIRIYDFQYDQYFCPRPSCNERREPFCKNIDCKFCSIERPPKPLPTFGINEDTFPKRSGQGWGKMKFVSIDS